MLGVLYKEMQLNAKLLREKVLEFLTQKTLSPSLFPVSPFFALIFIIYGILGCFGYGSDNDTYGMLHSGQRALLDGVYQYSRPPGYLIPELFIGGASLLGSYLLTNLISALFATASLYLFWRLLSNHFTNTDATLIVAAVGFNPYFVIAASSTMDYVYSIFFGLLGVTALRANRYFVAAPLFALAISSRLSNTLIIGIIYIYFLYTLYGKAESEKVIKLIVSGLLAVCLAVLLFVPSYVVAGNTFGFMTYFIGEWTFVGYLSRFFYKNIYLFGLVPFLLLVGMFIRNFARKNMAISSTPEVLAGISILVVHEILFLKVPIEISYLLPLLFVAIPISFVVLRPGKAAMYTFLCATILYGFVVNLDIMDRKYNEAHTEAISAGLGLFVRPGIIVDDLYKRERSEMKYLGKIGLNRKIDAQQDAPSDARTSRR